MITTLQLLSNLKACYQFVTHVSARRLNTRGSMRGKLREGRRAASRRLLQRSGHTSHGLNANEIVRIHFALLMPFSGSWNVGKLVAGAAALAVERVHADKALLPGRHLEYSWADSGCSAQQGLAAMGTLLREASRVDAVIGPGCSSACLVTSYLARGQQFPSISWGCKPQSASCVRERLSMHA